MKHQLNQILMVLAVASIAAAWPAAAHHATSMFAHDKTVVITGVVKEVHWTNPHVAIHVEGAQKGEKRAMWVLEMTSPGNLAREGQWTRTSFKPGDKVHVELAPLKNGGKGGALKRMINTDSTLALTANLQAQERAVEK